MYSGSRWALEQPYRIAIASDQAEASLLSFNGTRLYTWTAPGPYKLAFATLVDRPEEFGGGKAVVLGIGGESREDTPLHGHLSLIPLGGNLNTPVWQRRVLQNELPAMLPDTRRVADAFELRSVQIHDIFNDAIAPGPEIVATFLQGPYSQSVVRVYDLNGHCLMSFWHDGSIIDSYWAPDSNLLVFLGVNGEAEWPDRGFLEVEPLFHPAVVFAVHPQHDAHRSDWINGPNQGQPSLAWYHCLLPPSHANEITILELNPPHLGDDRNAICRLRTSLRRHTEQGISWLVDRDGFLVSGSAVVGTGYPLGDPRYPTPHDFYLGDLPAVINR